MGQYDENSAKQVEFLQFINDAAESIKKNPEKFKSEYEKLTLEEKQKINQQSKKQSEAFNELIVNDLLEEVNEAKRNKFMNSIKNPELIFFFRVQAPCFMLYGTYPHMLLKKAQADDDEALEKLIRLDKSIIFDPKISEIIHQAQVLKAQAKMTMIKKAFISNPKSKFSMKKVKCLMGGLISYFSIKMNQKLSAAEIRKLFDAIARDKTDDIDHDLGDLVGAVFEKPIQRSRSFWDVILVDKK
jgi:dGTP triphosphohydrolase